MALLETDSILGGQKIEGIVIKCNDIFGPDGKAMKAKIVSERFKEVHEKSWGARNPNSKGILETLSDTLRSEVRWEKAVFHKREEGLLEGSPKDIGMLIPAIQGDIKAECEDMIKEKLFAWAWSQLSRRSVAGFAEWYKKLLLEQQEFSEE